MAATWTKPKHLGTIIINHALVAEYGLLILLLLSAFSVAFIVVFIFRNNVYYSLHSNM